jgi:hypothetical protein
MVQLWILIWFWFLRRSRIYSTLFSWYWWFCWQKQITCFLFESENKNIKNYILMVYKCRIQIIIRFEIYGYVFCIIIFWWKLFYFSYYVTWIVSVTSFLRRSRTPYEVEIWVKKLASEKLLWKNMINFYLVIKF